MIYGHTISDRSDKQLVANPMCHIVPIIHAATTVAVRRDCPLPLPTFTEDFYSLKKSPFVYLLHDNIPSFANSAKVRKQPSA